MWSLVLLTIMLALAGAYGQLAARTDNAAQHGASSARAESMALYRAAVVRYFHLHAGQVDTGVDLATLRADGLLRSWSTLAPGEWDNYRAPDGVIYVYAPGPPEPGLDAALVRLAHGSLLAGVYRAGLPTLQSPLGDSGIPLAPLLARRSLPDGAPVWLAVAE